MDWLKVWALPVATVIAALLTILYQIHRQKKKRKNLRLALRAEAVAAPNFTDSNPGIRGAEKIPAHIPNDVYESRVEDLGLLTDDEIMSAVVYHSVGDLTTVISEESQRLLDVQEELVEKWEDEADSLASGLRWMFLEDAEQPDFIDDSETAPVENDEVPDGFKDEIKEIATLLESREFEEFQNREGEYLDLEDIEPLGEFTSEIESIRDDIDMLKQGKSIEGHLRRIERSRQLFIHHLEQNLPPRYQTHTIDPHLMHDSDEDEFFEQIVEDE